MLINKSKLIIAVQSLLEEEMIEQEDVPLVQSYLESRNYANLYGKLKWELAANDCDIFYDSPNMLTWRKPCCNLDPLDLKLLNRPSK